MWEAKLQPMAIPPRQALCPDRRGSSITFRSRLLLYLLLVSLLKVTVEAFDAGSNEMPLDPNSGIRSAYTNEPVLVKPMPHQATDYEKAPFEYWHENKPFVHVHGTEPENSELRHQHFPMNYYDNFNNFITDPPGTGLNVRSIDDFLQPVKEPAPESFPTFTLAPSSQLPANLERPIPFEIGHIGPTNKVDPSINQIIGGHSVQNLAARFPNSFQPDLTKLVRQEVAEPNTSGEENIEERAAGRLPWTNFKPSNDFDTYEDIPSDFKANKKPSKPAAVPSFPAPLAGPSTPKWTVTIRPPRLLPFETRKGGRERLGRKRVDGLIVSREQEGQAPSKTEGQPSAIVVGLARPKSGSYLQKAKPQPYKTVAPSPFNQPLPSPTKSYAGPGPADYPAQNKANYPAQQNRCCGCSSNEGGCRCCEAGSDCSPGCCASRGCAPSGCECCYNGQNCGGGGLGCCMGGGGNGCQPRLIINCGTEEKPCNRQLRSVRTRLLFVQRRLRRCTGNGGFEEFGGKAQKKERGRLKWRRMRRGRRLTVFDRRSQNSGLKP